MHRVSAPRAEAVERRDGPFLLGFKPHTHTHTHTRTHPPTRVQFGVRMTVFACSQSANPWLILGRPVPCSAESKRASGILRRATQSTQDRRRGLLGRGGGSLWHGLRFLSLSTAFFCSTVVTEPGLRLLRRRSLLSALSVCAGPVAPPAQRAPCAFVRAHARTHARSCGSGHAPRGACSGS